MPPLVTDCLEAPSSHVPEAPKRPESLSDRYVVELESYINRLLGVITVDRIEWRGERRCVRQKADAGQIR